MTTFLNHEITIESFFDVSPDDEEELRLEGKKLNIDLRRVQAHLCQEADEEELDFAEGATDRADVVIDSHDSPTSVFIFMEDKSRRSDNELYNYREWRFLMAENFA